MTSSKPAGLDKVHPTAQSLEGIGPQAEHILKQSGYSALREIGCKAHEGLLYLSGRVRSHYLKQIAQASVSKVEGVHGVINQIEVDVSGPAQGPTPTRSDFDRSGDRHE